MTECNQIENKKKSIANYRPNEAVGGEGRIELSAQSDGRLEGKLPIFPFDSTSVWTSSFIPATLCPLLFIPLLVLLLLIILLFILLLLIRLLIVLLFLFSLLVLLSSSLFSALGLKQTE